MNRPGSIVAFEILSWVGVAIGLIHPVFRIMGSSDPIVLMIEDYPVPVLLGMGLPWLLALALAIITFPAAHRRNNAARWTYVGIGGLLLLLLLYLIIGDEILWSDTDTWIGSLHAVLLLAAIVLLLTAGAWFTAAAYGQGGYGGQAFSGGYPPHGGYPPPPAGSGYPPQGGYPPPPGGYPPSGGGYPPR